MVLRRMLALLREKRSWRGVAVALNREGVRTRGWAPMERDGRVVRKGKPPSEWAPQSVRRVLLQPANAGTLAYNRRRARGRTHVARPASEHVLVEGYCEPIFSAEEADELRRIAAEIEGTPPARTGSQHLLSGLVFCRCGARMYPARNYVDTRRGRQPVVYYRCRRATHAGTCATRQVPSAVLEPLVAHELRSLGLDPVRLRALAARAAGRFAADAGLLFERRAALAREAERLTNRDETLLELVEDRLIDKEEFARRRGRLAEERATDGRRAPSVGGGATGPRGHGRRSRRDAVRPRTNERRLRRARRGRGSAATARDLPRTPGRRRRCRRGPPSRILGHRRAPRTGRGRRAALGYLSPADVKRLQPSRAHAEAPAPAERPPIAWAEAGRVSRSVARTRSPLLVARFRLVHREHRRHHAVRLLDVLAGLLGVRLCRTARRGVGVLEPAGSHVPACRGVERAAGGRTAGGPWQLLAVTGCSLAARRCLTWSERAAGPRRRRAGPPTTPPHAEVQVDAQTEQEAGAQPGSATEPGVPAVPAVDETARLQIVRAELGRLAPWGPVTAEALATLETHFRARLAAVVAARAAVPPGAGAGPPAAAGGPAPAPGPVADRVPGRPQHPARLVRRRLPADRRDAAVRAVRRRHAGRPGAVRRRAGAGPRLRRGRLGVPAPAPAAPGGAHLRRHLRPAGAARLRRRLHLPGARAVRHPGGAGAGRGRWQLRAAVRAAGGAPGVERVRRAEPGRAAGRLGGRGHAAGALRVARRRHDPAGRRVQRAGLPPGPLGRAVRAAGRVPRPRRRRRGAGLAGRDRSAPGHRRPASSPRPGACRRPWPGWRWGTPATVGSAAAGARSGRWPWPPR